MYIHIGNMCGPAATLAQANICTQTDANLLVFFNLTLPSPGLTSSVSLPQQQMRSCSLNSVQITDEQREKIQKNRLFAMEVRRKRLNQPLRLAIRNAHPLDARITFDEDEHVYTLDQSIQFPVSVSGVWANIFCTDGYGRDSYPVFPQVGSRY